MYLIGIDIGTGSTKAIAVDTTGSVLLTSQIAYPTHSPAPSYSEQEPEVIWEAFIKCIQKITTSLTSAPQAICLSSAMHSLILVDRQGNALMNMITWADNRSADVANRIKHSSQGKKIYEETGTPIHAMSPLCKILWLKENEDTLFKSTYKFISIKEYIWFKLHHVFEVDYAIASATGLFDIESREWHAEAMAITGISGAQLSTPVSTQFIRTLTDDIRAQQLHLPTQTKFMIGASDGCLANVGSVAIRPGVAALTIGTSGAIRVASKTPIRNFGAMTFNYILDEETFICGGPINNGGIALKWYAENFLGKKLSSAIDYQELLQFIENIYAGSDGLIFLPYILGERAPIWNSESCGVFFGITAQHKQAHFTRAVLEGICLALYQIGKNLEDSGLKIEQINVSGGFIHSHAWLQILADIFGKKICLVNAEDASALGATFMGMKTLGIIDNYNNLKPDDSKSFLPNDIHHKVYSESVFPLYEQLYKALMMEMTILHERKNNDLIYAK